MIMTEVDSLMPLVQVELTGCPNALVRDALLRGAAEFCERSLIWRETADPDPVLAGESCYDIEVPVGARVVLLTHVWMANRELDPVDGASLGRLLPDWQSAQGEPRFYRMAGADTYRIFPTPAQTLGAMTVQAAYAPLRSATALPDFLTERYGEGVAAGALTRLKLLPGKPWSDPAGAQYAQQRFLYLCDEARATALHDGVTGSLAPRPVRFGR